jgi:hypothetical protein
MCLIPTPRAECSSMDIYAILETEEERIEANHMHFINNFLQIPAEPLPAKFVALPYGIDTVPIINDDTIIEFDEINLQFFADTTSFVVPSSVFQEL